MPKADPLAKAASTIRKCTLAYPEAVEEFPWGESAFKVNKKIFCAMHRPDGGLSVTVKLPESAEYALSLPFAERTGYGLGKHGWVTSRFEPGEDVPIEMLLEWIDESYRAIAPKRLVAGLE